MERLREDIFFFLLFCETRSWGCLVGLVALATGSATASTAATTGPRLAIAARPSGPSRPRSTVTTPVSAAIPSIVAVSATAAAVPASVSAAAVPAVVAVAVPALAAPLLIPAPAAASAGPATAASLGAASGPAANGRAAHHGRAAEAASTSAAAWHEPAARGHLVRPGSRLLHVNLLSSEHLLRVSQQVLERRLVLERDEAEALATVLDLNRKIHRTMSSKFDIHVHMNVFDRWHARTIDAF